MWELKAHILCFYAKKFKNCVADEESRDDLSQIASFLSKDKAMFYLWLETFLDESKNAYQSSKSNGQSFIKGGGEEL